MTNPANFRLLSWTRQGLGGSVSRNGGEGAIVSVRLRLNHAQDIDVPIRLYGPGDVTGIDSREIIRTEPHHLAADFEPNYFPLVEFDRPDFPWLFSPEAPDADRRLLPWICLVVVPKETATLTADASMPLPVLNCPLAELPDLSQSWAWAHAQVAMQDDTNVEAALHNVERTVSRLLSPRRLLANTAYYACVVPTYGSGRQAGLGESPTLSNAMAWPNAASGDTRCMLPIYHHWEFSTGIGGDFESLASKLNFSDDSGDVGVVPIDVSSPGWGMPQRTGSELTTIEMTGALTNAGRPPRVWDTATANDFIADLTKQLVAVRAPSTETESPRVGPPWYGQTYVSASRSLASVKPTWLQDLNLDPRYRIAAGLGTSVVRYEQETLVASAWEQLAKNRADLQKEKQIQFSETISQAIASKHLKPLAPERLLQILGPLKDFRTDTPRDAKSNQTQNRTVAVRAPAAASKDNWVDGAVLSPEFRRLSRPGGNTSQRWDNQDWDSPVRPSSGADIPKLSTERAAPVVREAWRYAVVRDQGTIPIMPENWQALASEQGIDQRLDLWRSRVENRRQELLEQVSPQPATPSPEQSSNVDPSLFTPTFPVPMFQALRDYFQDFLLHGLAGIPVNTVALLETNPKFIEAFMVGLNHEMGRELLWRGFPVNLGGTFFQQFWDPRGRVPPLEPKELSLYEDFKPISEWSDTLGTHLLGSGAGGMLVLLIRGDLLRRYPRTVIYATKAILQDGKRALSTEERYPVFRLSQDPDFTLFAFKLDKTEAIGNVQEQEAGWFFVLQEQPTELRFGLDVGDFTSEPPADWASLTWGHVADSATTLGRLSYVPLGGRLEGLISESVRWGANSAEMAFITRQPAFRVAIHASTWLVKKEELPNAKRPKSL